MKNRARSKIILFAIVIALGMFQAPAKCEDAGSLRMGVTLPLTGPGAEWGIAASNGFQMARSEQPKLFENIEFFFEDTQLDPKNAVTAFNKLRASDGIQIAYDFGSATTGAIGPIAERNKLPLLSAAYDPSVSVGKLYVIRFANYSAQYADALLQYMRTKGYTQYGIVATENAFFNSLVEAFKTNLRSDESIVFLEKLSPDATTFKSTITKLKNASAGSGIHALGVYTFAGQGIQFLREASEQDLKLPLFASDSFESEDMVADSEGKMEGLVYPNNSVNDEFRKRYESRYGNVNQITFAGSAYDLAILIGEIASKTPGKITSDTIQAELEKPIERSGVLGQFRFRNVPEVGKYFEFPIVIKKISGNKIGIVSSETP
jgi:ABC-type branched-subunit amino acid transport system substrate-binding protein